MIGSEIVQVAVERGLVPAEHADRLYRIVEGIVTDVSYDERAAARQILTRAANNRDFLTDTVAILNEQPGSVGTVAGFYRPVAIALARDLPVEMQAIMAAAAAEHRVAAGTAMAWHDGWPLDDPIDAWWKSVASRFDIHLWQQYRGAAGYSLGVELQRRLTGAVADADRVLDLLRSTLQRWRANDAEQVAKVLLPGALLWLTLAQFAASDRWSRGAERRALEEDVRQRAHWDPSLWVESLPWLLRRVLDIDELDVSITIELAAAHESVRKALDDHAKGGFHDASRRAAGIQSLAVGDAPTSDRTRWLLGIVAQHADAARAFPRPLDLPTRTWLASRQLEEALDAGLRHGSARFAEDVRHQGQGEEEALLKALLVRLEHALTDPQLHLDVLEPILGSNPRIVVEQRPVPKSEERNVGADLGLVVDVDLPGELRTTYGALVQVKKSERLVGTSSAGADAWRIGVRQLRDLLSSSSSSFYWLIREDGSVLCLPGRFVMALSEGRQKLGQGSFTINYADVRHAVVTLPQFIHDLLLGMWAGGDERTLAIATGEDARTAPMALVTIRVRSVDQ